MESLSNYYLYKLTTILLAYSVDITFRTKKFFFWVLKTSEVGLPVYYDNHNLTEEEIKEPHNVKKQKNYTNLF